MKRSHDSEVERIQAEADRIFAETMRCRWQPHGGSVWHPPTDVYETDDSVVVTVEIAGLEAGEYQLTLTNRWLVVRGRRTAPTGKLVYRQMEIRHGEFRTQVHLPWPLHDGSDEIDATYADGFLRVVLRKAEPLRVPVTCEDSDGVEDG
jgi:HSP20 family protein